MSRLLLDSVLWLTGVGDALLQEMNYRLTVISDEEVPLAVGNLPKGSSFFPITMAVMAAVLIGMTVSLYYFRCRSYQKRILELGGEKKNLQNGWNLVRLKETVQEMEWDLTADNQELILHNIDNEGEKR